MKVDEEMQKGNPHNNKTKTNLKDVFLFCVYSLLHLRTLKLYVIIAE